MKMLKETMGLHIIVIVIWLFVAIINSVKWSPKTIIIWLAVMGIIINESILIHCIIKPKRSVRKSERSL